VLSQVAGNIAQPLCRRIKAFSAFFMPVLNTISNPVPPLFPALLLPLHYIMDRVSEMVPSVMVSVKIIILLRAPVRIIAIPVGIIIRTVKAIEKGIIPVIVRIEAAVVVIIPWVIIIGR
jgi:hypothetical protein